jgi:hypothetical protein
MEVSMADTAFQIQYRQEFIATFEQHQSLVRDFTTTEAVIKGNQATFLVAGTGGATAVTRGVNGMIPARADDLTQKTATLAEWHDLVRKTGFNVFASQGNQREIMQMTTMAVINRKIDSDIITTLNTGTLDTGAAATASLAMALRSKTILGNNGVPFDGQICGLITPAYEAYLLMTKEFASADYVGKKPMDNADTAWADKPGYYRWLGVNWVVHPNLPGVGTNAEKCFMFHKSSIGHAANKEGLQSPVGYDEEQDYSWARASIDMGAVLLQNSGVVVMNHDGSAFAAE